MRWGIVIPEPLRQWLYSVVGLAGFLIGAYILILHGLPLVLPFAVALLVAEFMEPFVTALTLKGRVPRGIAVAIVMLILVGLILTAVTAAIGKLVEELQLVVQQLPYLYAIGTDLATRFAEQFGTFHATLPESIQTVLNQNLLEVQKSLGAQLKQLTTTLGVVASLPAFLTNLLVALMATFFISRDKALISGFLLQLFPTEWRPKLRKVKNDVWSSTIGFAKAQLTLILLTMLQVIIGLTIIGAEYSVLMGVVVGVADVLPVLGPASVFLPWIAYTFIFGGSAGKFFAIKLLVLYVIVAGVRQVLEVKVVGDRLGLHPLAILLSIYLGFQFFGAMGFVVGPLLAILLKSMIKSDLLPIFKE